MKMTMMIANIEAHNPSTIVSGSGGVCKVPVIDVGENIVVDGIGVDDNTGVLGVTLETAVGVDTRNAEAGVSEALAIGDMELIERVGIGVDVTREGIVIKLEDTLSCGVGVAVGVLDMAGI